jgi:hypothetical protein
MSTDRDMTCTCTCGCGGNPDLHSPTPPISRSRHDSASGELNPDEHPAATAAHEALAKIETIVEKAEREEREREDEKEKRD